MKIVFVCHGNICRSPMAEYIMKKLCEKENYIIESRATSYEEIGNDLYYLAKEVLDKNKIPYNRHFAKRITKEDYKESDYVIVMDQNNLNNLKKIIGDTDYQKVYKLLEFTGIDKDVEDPWYSRQFDDCFNEIKNGCVALYNKIMQE